MAQFDAEEFWDFSLSLYKNERIKNACLIAQDTLSADVNLILMCVWLDTQQVTLSTAAKAKLIAESNTLQTDVMRPLRQKRSLLEKGSAAYEKALAVELEAEKGLQARYVAILNDEAVRTISEDSPTSSSLSWYQHHISADDDFASLFKPCSEGN